MKYGIWRIIGNEFPPRYPEGQNEANVKFVLENEERLENAETVWVLNRIVDTVQCSQLGSVLRDHNQRVEIIPFDVDRFRTLSTAQERVLYVTGVNTARNWCIAEGLRTADVVIPLGSGMAFRYDAWQQFVYFTEMSPEDPFYSVGVWRGRDTEEFFGKRQPNLRECFQLEDHGNIEVIGMSEPRVAFTKTSDKLFDMFRAYGDFDNTELLYRLGIMGVWDRSQSPVRTEALKYPSKFYGRTPLASWVYKLPAEVEGVVGEFDNEVRRKAKKDGVAGLLRKVGQLLES